MNNGLQIFENEMFGNVRVLVDTDNEIWFIGKDVVEVLGYDLSGKHVASEYINKFVDEDDFINYTKESSLCFKSEFDYKVLGQRGGYLINESGLYSLVSKSNKISAKDKKEFLVSLGLDENKIVLSDRFEISFKNNLDDTLNVFNIDVEYQKQCLSYRLDFYIPSVNLVIEYDENHHNRPINKKQDEIRENKIKELLNCEILRLDYKDTDATNVGLVLKKIKELGGL